MGPHLISGATALVLFFPCLISQPPPLLTLLACGSICMDRQIRQAASVSDKGYGSPPRRTGRRRCDTTSAIHESRAALDWPHTSATFFLISPPPSRLNFHERNRNNCPQVAFSRHPAKPGSRLNSTSDSFWTWRGGRGLLDLVCVSCTTKRKNEIS